MPVVRSRATAVCAAAFVTAGLVFGSGVAVAVPPLPIVDSAECDAAVDASQGVQSAQAELDGALTSAEDAADAVTDAQEAQTKAAAALNAVPSTDPGFAAAEQAVSEASAALDAARADQKTADEAVTTAQTALTQARGLAVASLCATETPEPTPTPTPTPEPTTEPQPTTPPAPSGDDAEAVFARISTQIRDLSCDAYGRESGAISDALFSFDTFQLLGAEGTGALQDQLNERNRELNFCFDNTPVAPPVPLTDDRDCADFTTPGEAQAYFLARRTAAQPDPDRLDRNGNGVACEGAFGDDPVSVINVDPLADDDSVADTDGTQIEVVPNGSISTGAA